MPAEMAVVKATAAATHTGWGVREAAIACGPGGCFEGRARGNPDRGGAHQGAIRLAFAVRCSARRFGAAALACGGRGGKRPCDRYSTIEWFGLVPTRVGCRGQFVVVAARRDDGAGECQRQFGIVGRLTGESVPVATVREVPYAIGIKGADLVSRLEFHQSAETVADHLAEQAADGAVRACPIAGKTRLDARRTARSQDPFTSCKFGGCSGRSGEEPVDPALPVCRVAHLDAALVEHDAAGGGNERMAAGNVVGRKPVPGGGRNAVSGRNAGEAVGDAGQRDEAGRCCEPPVILGAKARSDAQKDEASGDQHGGCKMGAHRHAVAREIPGSLGPGDKVWPAVRRGGCIDDAEHRPTFGEKGDGDCAAAMAAQKIACAVVRIDHPAESAGEFTVRTFLFADESRGKKGSQSRAEELLDFDIDRRLVFRPARAGRAIELGGEHLSRFAYRLAHRVEKVGKTVGAAHRACHRLILSSGLSS